MKIIVKDTNQILLDSCDMKDIKQSIFCGKQGKCLRDNHGKVYIDDVKKIQMQIECIAKAVPSLNGSYVGKEMIVWCDQRVYELLDNKNNATNASLRYEPQKHTLALHKDEIETINNQKTSENNVEIKTYKQIWDAIDSLPTEGMVSYKPIIYAVLASFSMHTNEDLTSTCIMMFEEQ